MDIMDISIIYNGGGVDSDRYNAKFSFMKKRESS